MRSAGASTSVGISILEKRRAAPYGCVSSACQIHNRACERTETKSDGCSRCSLSAAPWRGHGSLP
eukprot:3735585-Pleurochrysis_carterae.AAC.2